MNLWKHTAIKDLPDDFHPPHFPQGERNSNQQKTQVQNALHFGKEINMYLQEWPSALLSAMT